MLRPLSILVTLLLLLFAAGCSGPERGTVSGTVTLDGQPIAGVFVVLQPDGHSAPQARGVSDDGGEFALHPDDGSEGIVVGHYRVTVLDIQTAAPPGNKEDDGPEAAPAGSGRVPVRYQRGDKTPLEVDVSADAIQLEVPLTSTGE